MEAKPEELIYDWNARNRRGPLSPLHDRSLSFFDETLRDGIQSPSVPRRAWVASLWEFEPASDSVMAKA